MKPKQKSSLVRIRKGIIRHWQLYLLVMPPIAYLIIFKYIPMIGTVIAFKDYNFVKGIFGSNWVGVKHFVNFFRSPQFKTLMLNTIGLSFYQIIAGITPIIGLNLRDCRLSAPFCPISRSRSSPLLL